MQLPNYKAYWSREIPFPPVVDVMPINQYEKLRQYLHYVDNSAPNSDNDKLFKVRPIITTIRDTCIKVEPEEFQAVNEQVIPYKTKRRKIRQYNPKKPSLCRKFRHDVWLWHLLWKGQYRSRTSRPTEAYKTSTQQTMAQVVHWQLVYNTWTLSLFNVKKRFVLLERFEQTVSRVIPRQLIKIWKNKEEVNLTIM